jgi:hypothetical protein
MYLFYHYSRKVRCLDCSGDICDYEYTPKIYSLPKQSSQYSSNLSSKHIQSSSLAYSNKGKGNLQKKGSGGNSYASFLSRKKGNILCNCDVVK